MKYKSNLFILNLLERTALKKIVDKLAKVVLHHCIGRSSWLIVIVFIFILSSFAWLCLLEGLWIFIVWLAIADFTSKLAQYYLPLNNSLLVLE